MRRVPLLVSTVVYLLSIAIGQPGEATTDVCANIFEERISGTSISNCTAELISLNSVLSQQPINSDCEAFSVFNLSSVVDCQWAQNTLDCLIAESPLNFGRVSGNSPMFLLQSITCAQYAVHENSSCSCKMDCLMSFHQANEMDKDAYGFFGAVSCNTSQLDFFKNHFGKPDMNVTLIRESSSFTSCDVTDSCSPSASVEAMSSSLLTPSPSPSLFQSLSSSLSLLTSSSLFSESPALVTTSVRTPGSIAASPTMELPTVDKCPTVSPILDERASFCSDMCASADSNFGSVLVDACSTTSKSYAVDLSNVTSDLNETVQCLANTSPDDFNLLFSNSCEQPTTKIRVDCDQCNCADKNRGCGRTCVLWFGSPVTYMVLAGVSSSGSETESLLQLIARSSCLEQDDVNLLGFDDCPCAQTLTPTPSQPENTNEPVSGGIPAVVLVVIAVVGIVALIVVLMSIMLCICLVCHRRRNKCRSTDLLAATNSSFGPNSPRLQDSGATTSVEMMSLYAGYYVNTTKNVEVILQQTPMTLNLSKWQQVFGHVLVEPSQIIIQETIGEGAFGMVHRGVLVKEDGSQKLVAIKTLKGKDASTHDQVEEFVAESAIMLDFHHPNVIKLLAVCFNTEDNLPLIVLPYMANGDLKSFLQQKRHHCAKGALPKGVDVPMLMDMCLNIAEGMQYLANCKFVHRDLAARNCMVDDEMKVKVADFGLSRDVYSRDYYRLERRAKLPVKWMPPESLNDNIFNEKSDVWSFGVTCWEVFSLGKTPYPSIDNAEIVDYIERGIRLKKPSLCPKEMYFLLSSCWDEDPEKRPRFDTLVESFGTITTNWRSSVVSDSSKVGDEDELHLSYEQLYSDFSGDSDNSMTVMCDSLGGKVEEVVFRKEDASNESGNSDGSCGRYSHLAPVEDSHPICATNFCYKAKEEDRACEPGSLPRPSIPHGVPRAYSSRENSCPNTPQICPHGPGKPCTCCSFEHTLEASLPYVNSSFEDTGAVTTERSLSSCPQTQLSKKGRTSSRAGTADCRDERPGMDFLSLQSTPYLTPLKSSKNKERQFLPDEEDDAPINHVPPHHYFVLEQPQTQQVTLTS